MEKYNINISNGWAIEALKYSDQTLELDKVAEQPWGQYEFYQDEVVWMYDPFVPSEERIKECLNNELYNKKVSFIVMKLNDKWEEIDKFQGTFIDALIYIQNYLNTTQNPS